MDTEIFLPGERERLAVVDPFHAVADPTRRAILDRLERGDAPVTELAAGFPISRPAVSKHLRVLRDARLVRERRGGADGRQRIYSITPQPLGTIAEWVREYAGLWPAELGEPERCVEQRHVESGRGQPAAGAPGARTMELDRE